MDKNELIDHINDLLKSIQNGNLRECIKLIYLLNLNTKAKLFFLNNLYIILKAELYKEIEKQKTIYNNTQYTLEDNNKYFYIEEEEEIEVKEKNIYPYERKHNNGATEYYPINKNDKKTYNFCTLAGYKYLIKVLTFYRGLSKNSNNFKLWICCMDDRVYNALNKLNLKNLFLFKLESLETEELKNVRMDRTESEYCWTLKGSLIEYIMNEYHVDSILYCDSDLYFYSNPAVIFEEWGEDSIFLCPQRDVPAVEKDYGTYQAGLVGFKNDTNGREALEWWKRKCIEWCYYRVDEPNERWADQKYLDKIPTMFKGVKISNNLGLNAAPWNIIYNNNFRISVKGKQVYINNDKLVAFHFALFTIFDKDRYDLWNIWTINISSIVKNHIYSQYIRDLRQSIDILTSNISGVEEYIYSSDNSNEAKNFYMCNNLRKKIDKYDEFYTFCAITSKEYLIKAITLYRSIKDKINNFQLFILCVDNTAYDILKKLKLVNVTLIRHLSVEKEFQELNEIKSHRSLKEYCWTLKAPLIKYVMDKYGIQSVVYLDSDLYFFDEPSKIFESWKDYSILMCDQRAKGELQRTHGYYQAGLVGFRRDNYGIPCLNWWKDRCLEWCYDNVDEGNERWGDQKYLDKIPFEFKSIKVVRDLGVNAAPWNIVENNKFKIDKKADGIYINNNKLIVYHFGSLLIFEDEEFDLWKLYPNDFEEEVVNNIYIPYLKELINTMDYLVNNGVNVYELISDKKNPQNLYQLSFGW
ncbi:glycosyl transferase [Clostridium sediminicola]|uniref:glycosyl transferase n=1 Tax=Clostridium sediminicola TaxID=3114879 RepID=UPI0031F267DA